MLAFLRGFKRILRHTQSGALDLRSTFAHSITLRLIWYGCARGIRIVMVFIRVGLPNAPETGTTGVAMRGVSELLPVSER